MPSHIPFSVSLAGAVAVQIACQLFKVVLYSLRERRLALSYFISAGGMPSAHSAFVTALSVSVGIGSGFSSDLFAVSCVFSVIIIYDAWRLRGAVEHHARILTSLVTRHPDLAAGVINTRIGHTPAELAAGMAVGGVFAALVQLAIRQL
jgi:acid phosphatase family membrane protein YuiD